MLQAKPYSPLIRSGTKLSKVDIEPDLALNLKAGSSRCCNNFGSPRLNPQEFLNLECALEKNKTKRKG